MHHATRPKQDVPIEPLGDPAWDGLPVWLVGIDDTDNLESRGTGFRARQLARTLQVHGLVKVLAVTRHQLFVSPDIPYTSHNSAACLVLRFAPANRAAVCDCAREYLLRESAEGADAGLCVAALDAVPSAVQAFGRRAKQEVLELAASHALAESAGIHLEGLTGTRQGAIGALAAVGLHATRDDGRYLWLRGTRDLAPGEYSLAELKARTDIEAFRSVTGETITDEQARIGVDDWARPVLTGGCAVLLLEEVSDERANGKRWRVAAKEHVKRH